MFSDPWHFTVCCSFNIFPEKGLLEQCVNGLAFGSFIASGQTCIMGARILVQRSVYDEVVDKLVEKVEGIRCGAPQDVHCQFGPLISGPQRQKVIDFVDCAKKEGARVLCGGKIPGKISRDFFDEMFFREILNQNHGVVTLFSLEHGVISLTD